MKNQKIKPLEKPTNTKKKKRKIKTERQKLIEANDKLYSLVVRTRDNFICQKSCGANGNRMHCAHIWSRRHMRIRWDIRNAITLCFYHHITWSHRTPVEFTEWIKERLGEKIYYELRDLAYKDVRPFTIEELKETNKKLKEQLEYYQNKNDNAPF